MSWVVFDVLRTRSAATRGEANVRNDESNQRQRSYSFCDYGCPKKHADIRSSGYDNGTLSENGDLMIVQGLAGRLAWCRG
jgi:hypothetical protein